METSFLPPGSGSNSRDVLPSTHPPALFSNLPPPDLIDSSATSEQPPQLTNDISTDSTPLPPPVMEHAGAVEHAKQFPNFVESERVIATNSTPAKNSPVVES